MVMVLELRCGFRLEAECVRTVMLRIAVSTLQNIEIAEDYREEERMILAT